MRPGHRLEGHDADEVRGCPWEGESERCESFNEGKGDVAQESRFGAPGLALNS